jgi:hypothetical protein
MTSNSAGSALDTSRLIARLINDLNHEFPGWIISRDRSGRWSAARPNWGVLHGQCSAELRERLRQYSPEVGGDV